VVPAIVTGLLAVLLLVVNIGNQRVFLILTSMAIILFYIPYLMVTFPMLLKRLRGQWPRAEHGPHFSMGRWGLPVNIVAVLYGALMTVNLALPRVEVYGNDHWYFQWGAILFTAVIVAIGALILVVTKRHRITPTTSLEPGPGAGASEEVGA
jgi:amino acid transporter